MIFISQFCKKKADISICSRWWHGALFISSIYIEDEKKSSPAFLSRRKVSPLYFSEKKNTLSSLFSWKSILLMVSARYPINFDPSLRYCFNQLWMSIWICISKSELKYNFSTFLTKKFLYSFLFSIRIRNYEIHYGSNSFNRFMVYDSIKTLLLIEEFHHWLVWGIPYR